MATDIHASSIHIHVSVNTRAKITRQTFIRTARFKYLRRCESGLILSVPTPIFYDVQCCFIRKKCFFAHIFDYTDCCCFKVCSTCIDVCIIKQYTLRLLAYEQITTECI